MRVFKLSSHCGVSEGLDEVKKGKTDIGPAWSHDGLQDLNECHEAQTSLEAWQLALAEAHER